MATTLRTTATVSDGSSTISGSTIVIISSSPASQPEPGAARARCCLPCHFPA